MFPHLQAILPDLKACFAQAYVSLPPDTRGRAGVADWFASDDFFIIFPLEKPLPIGEHFTCLYRKAARAADPEQVLHLCYLDRLSFALETSHRERFMADVTTLAPDDLPLLFHRSPAAWKTHPANYARLEGFVTRVGETLFGKTLDYGWCHLVVRAGELAQVMQKVTHSGLSVVAEMILHMQDHIHIRDVDWLEWEDPFLLKRDPDELRRERESSLEETEKRLSYVLPMVEMLVKFAREEKEPG